MKKEKLLQKSIKSPRNLRFSEFETLLINYGFEYRPKRGKGSHKIYKNREWKKTISIQPLENGKAKGYQVEEFLRMLRCKNVL